MRPLDPKSKAATILLRNHIGAGYAAGPDFPGDTIRKAIDALYKRGYLATDKWQRMIVTRAGQQYLSTHHRGIPS